MLFLMQSALVELDEFLEQNFMSGAFKNESMMKIAGFLLKKKLTKVKDGTVQSIFGTDDDFIVAKNRFHKDR